MNAVEIIQKLVKEESYSSEESSCANAVKEIMETLGYDEIVTTKSGSVVGLFGPKSAPVKVLFDGHIDIASVAGEWSFDPFCAEVRDGKILGRGTTDMKGGLGAAIYAVAEYAKSNTLDYRIAVSATVMEEVIEGLGLEEPLDYCKPECVVICEPTELCTMMGQKGRMEITITALGKSAHASNPEVGINSMYIACDILKAIENIDVPQDAILGSGILVPTDIITEPYPSISQIPAKTKIRLDRRSLPGETEEQVLNDIAEHLKKHNITDFTVEVNKQEFTCYTGEQYTRSISLPPWSISQESKEFKAMHEGAKEVLGNEAKVSAWICCTNGSECAGRRKIPTVGMGPGSIQQAHIVDEYIEVDQVEKVTKIYYNFIKNMLA